MREDGSQRHGLTGLRDDLDRRWMALIVVAWLAYVAYALWSNWNGIRWLSLGDTDDNMRLAQVRAWLAGQGWYDLRQYRLNPPAGFDMHWSRIVDLPLAGLILFFRLFTSDSWAERLACGIAPLLPLAITLLALGATVRRLVHPLAWPLAIAVLFCAIAPMQMYAPERIDHHGWQLALLALTLAGLTDPRQIRGGVTVGLATALSLSIGLEMLPYGAMAGGILALRWVWDAAESPRLQAYAAALGGGTALGFVLFASNANRGLRCDTLTPVWLSVAVAAGGLLFLLAHLNPQARPARLGLALVVAAAVAAGFAFAFPQCLGRPEQVSDELARNWLANVKEARPIYRHAFRLGFSVAVLPVIGLIGAAVALRRAWGGPQSANWLAATLFSTFAAAMLLWQMRAGPAAALLAVPGATALGAILLPALHNHRSAFVRVIGTAGAFMLVTGLFAWWVVKYLPVDPPSPYRARVNAATGDCMRTSRLLALDRYPRATVFTMVDLGPRIITVTHHDAVAGPYHRNGEAILDVQHAFGGASAAARNIIKRHGATLLLLCPNMAESTIYRSRNKGGFYDQLARGRRFDWLQPLPLPRRSPFRLYRVS